MHPRPEDPCLRIAGAGGEIFKREGGAVGPGFVNPRKLTLGISATLREGRHIRESCFVKDNLILTYGEYIV